MLSLPRFPGKEIKHVLGYNCELTYQLSSLEVEEKERRKKQTRRIVKRAVAPMAREIQLGRERRSFFFSFLFFLYEIIIVKSLKYSRAAHLDANRGKINERKSL